MLRNYDILANENNVYVLVFFLTVFVQLSGKFSWLLVNKRNQKLLFW